ncbi:MAG: D-2-hydroxyacid dehydrogenase [Fimbriimonadaceae bacterium]|nr:D-2-hydroxyacid dehydrogenase [Fimbriimonadaceae bacterium]
MTIWSNAGLDAIARTLLEEGTRGHRFVRASEATTNLGGGRRSKELEEADVAFGQPDPDQVVANPRVRWVHLTSAGYTRYDTDAFREGIARNGAVLTNSSSVYADPCAQHVLGFMMAHARRLLETSRDQAAGAGWTYARHRPLVRVLRGDRVLMLGYGAIARRLAELLAPFGVEVHALRRTRRTDDPTWVVEANALDALLAEADHVVDVLPASPTTERFVDRSFLARMKPGAVFTNVGRGTTVDQHALAEALTTGRLGAAYLDVTDPEPLPAEHPLWAVTNCHITPHVAGGHQDEDTHLVRHFLANLDRFEKGEPLLDRVFGP